MSNDSKIYVGNLPTDIRKRDLEDIFYKYGKVLEVDLHDRRELPFAFIEFEDPRDAEDAIRGRDGYSFDGYKIKVEFPRSSNRGGDRDGGGYGRGGGGYRGRGGGNFNRRSNFGGRGNRPRGHQLVVTGLPPTGSWQDIKDHFRQAGDVVYADSQKDGTGVVEFARYDHAKRALRDLDDSKFRSHEGETAYIRVSEPHSRSKSRSNSRSPPPRRGSPKRYDSPRRSPRRSKSPPSHYDSRRSRSRSRSRSN